MAKSIATIEGTALVPGVSKNGRHYSKEAIAKAVARLSERITTGTNPAVMLTSHSADDDSRCIVGILSSVSLADDGSARFAAQIADTDEGRKIASLVDTRGGPAFLKGVSIRGAWIGQVTREVGPDGRPYEQAPDLEIDGLDFTRKPGVPGAEIETFIPTASDLTSETTSDGRTVIAESVQEALVTAITEDDGASAPEGATAVTITEADTTSDGPFADPGYQADKKKRYPLDTKSRAKSAWAYVNQADNARAYTSAQLKRVKQRIVKALKGYGVQVAAQEGWLIDPATAVSENLAECWDMPSPTGNLYISLTNGPTTVTVSSGLLDPHDLDLVGRAAMAGACQALLALDPDMDADIDVPGADAEDTGDDMGTSESAAVAVTVESLTPTPETSAPTPAAEPATEEEPAMAESITPAADTAASVPVVSGVHLTDDQFAQLLARVTPVAAPVEAAPAAVEPVVESVAPTAAVVTESEEQRIARLVAEGIKAAMPGAIQEHVELSGPPARKGLVENTTTGTAASASGIPADWPQKPLSDYTEEEFRQYVSPATVGAVLGARAQA